MGDEMKKWTAASLDDQWCVVCDDGHDKPIAIARDRETAILICRLHRVLVALCSQYIDSIDISTNVDQQSEK